jgi:SAM-dependent methyltransferase
MTQDLTYKYKGALYPSFLKNGYASRCIVPAALELCQGVGLDVGCGKWPLPGAIPVDLATGGDAMKLPPRVGGYDYIFSSHCLEHLADPIGALEHWKASLRKGGVLFLYLPHPDMEYWLPVNNRKHLHSWQPREMVKMLRDLGFADVMHSERDFAWSFTVVARIPSEAPLLDRSIAQWAAGEKYIHADPQLAALFAHFGADVFRRSAVLEDFAGFVAAQAANGGFKGKRCVEIGTFNGVTTLVLARHFEEVISIDTFPYTLKHQVLAFAAEKFGVKNIRFVDVADNAEKAEIIKGLDFDAAFSDGNHVSDTESDFALVERCGRVMFHEFTQDQPTVWHLVNRLQARCAKEGGTIASHNRFALWTRAEGK